MAIFEKSSATSGKWAKATELQDVKSARIVSEARKVESQFQDEKTGAYKMQTVAKVQFEGIEEALNVSLNRATVDGLIEAFGKDSASWQGHDLRVQTEKVQVAGRNTRALYLIPLGFRMTEDEGGYTIIVPERKPEGEAMSAFNAKRSSAEEDELPL